MGDKVTVGMDAPEFTLVDTRGNSVSLSDYRGEWVFLVFNRGFV